MIHKTGKIFFSLMAIVGVIACNEQEEDVSGIPSPAKNPISLSAKIGNNETMTRTLVSDFPNAVNNQAQVTVLAYIANHPDETPYINHEKVNVGANSTLPGYFLAWQKGKEQYWPSGEQELLLTAYNPIYTKDSNSNNRLTISLHPENWEMTPDVIVADPITAKYLPDMPVDLSFRHIMSSLNIKMKSASGDDVQVNKVELSIENNQSARFYNLKTAQWEKPAASTPSVNYLLSENIFLHSTPVNLSPAPILFFPGMEQFVRLTVYEKLSDSSYHTISMKLSDIKDSTGTPVPLLLPGVKSTLTLSLQSLTMVFNVDNCILQEWGVVNSNIINTLSSTRRQIEINMTVIKPLHIALCEKIQSVAIMSSSKEYRAMITSASLSAFVFSALTANLNEMPKSLDDRSQLTIYLKDNSIWTVPFSMYQHHYENDRLVLDIDSEIFDQ
jgi:hypothetical protein